MYCNFCDVSCHLERPTQKFGRLSDYYEGIRWISGEVSPVSARPSPRSFPHSQTFDLSRLTVATQGPSFTYQLHSKLAPILGHYFLAFVRFLLPRNPSPNPSLASGRQLSEINWDSRPFLPRITMHVSKILSKGFSYCNNFNVILLLYAHLHLWVHQ